MLCIEEPFEGKAVIKSLLLLLLLIHIIIIIIDFWDFGSLSGLVTDIFTEYSLSCHSYW